MKVENIYIGASSAVSFQETFGNPEWYLSLKSLPSEPVKAHAPDYKKYLDPMATRRMSKVLKNALLTAKQAMEQMGVNELDGVVTATAWGCQEDTTKFLDSFESMGEELLSPTSFIQSTHNTIGGLIAMSVKCNGYNNTISHDLMSFETALLDTILMMQEQQGNTTYYVGGIDELTDFSAGIFTRAACFSPKHTLSEGAVSFLLHDQSAQKKLAKITEITLSNVHDQSIRDIVTRNKPDLILSAVETMSFPLPSVDYKSVCGEFSTAVAFALFLASELFSKSGLREVLGIDANIPLSKIGIVNEYSQDRSSYIELEKC